ncbi:MAG: hypothetical protein HY432_00560 [Candidatus Liptonbacteria bacterium]|nr:hypothetical protein [Candidatus Liptonbacteria bacterium]
MEKKDLLPLVVGVVILAGGWFLYRQANPGIDNSYKRDLVAVGAMSVAIVDYDENGFLPSSVIIPKGGAVLFKNNSMKNLWVASDPHPSHGGYPEKNGCIGSAFDSCTKIPPGVSWSFTFGQYGSWDYHNHLNPSQGGTVNVE